MTTEIPTWLNNEYVQQVLEKGNDFTVKVEELKIDLPVAQGNNYSCDIFRAEVGYRKSVDNFKSISKTSLIIKAPKVGPLYEQLAKLGITEKEANIYTQLLPKLDSLFRENEQKENEEDDMFPKCYFSADNVLVLEDLKLKGYVMPDRMKRFDYKHCVIALKALAKFHAGSVVIHEKEPELIEKLGKETLFSTFFAVFGEGMFKMGFQFIGAAMQNWPGLEKYSKWVLAASENITRDAISAIKRKDGEFNVLNHGDFWLTNTLFTYDDNGEPSKIKLIDLQASRYTSPAADFLYFMYSSVQEEVRVEYFDEFINTYIKELNLHLERYGSSKSLGESEFKKTLKEREYCALFVTMNFLPMVLVDTNEVKLDMKDVSFEDLASAENNPMMGLLKSKKLIEILSLRFPEFEKSGLITL